MKQPKTVRRYLYKGFLVEIQRYNSSYEYVLTATSANAKKLMWQRYKGIRMRCITAKIAMHRRMRRIMRTCVPRYPLKKYDPSSTSDIGLCMWYAETNVNELCSPLYLKWS
jgi:hypothetical protein